MVFSGPKYDMSRSQAVQQSISVPTQQKGSFARGHKLLWRKNVPAVLPNVFQVPWTFVDEQGLLLAPRSLTPQEVDIWVWERVPETSDIEDDMGFIMVHLYFNYYLKHQHGKLKGINPILPLLDVQMWQETANVSTVTPMLYECNKHWTESADAFWHWSTLLSMLLLHATGVLHCDLSQNNLFRIRNVPCKLKYKDRTIVLPFFPVVTDFDSVCFAWETVDERQSNELEKDVVIFFFTRQKDNCIHYSKCELPAHLTDREFTTVEECLEYLFDSYSQPQPSVNEDAYVVDFTDATYFSEFYKDEQCRDGISFIMNRLGINKWNKLVYDQCSERMEVDVCDKPKPVAQKPRQLNLLALGFQSKKPRYAKTMLLLLY